jgi:AAA domain-containing protein
MQHQSSEHRRNRQASKAAKKKLDQALNEAFATENGNGQAKPRAGREGKRKAGQGDGVRKPPPVRPAIFEPDDQEGEGLFGELAADCKDEKTEWLWLNRLPRYTVSIIQGEKGAGKSSWLRRIAAAVSGGPALPGERKSKASVGWVLWYAGEEPRYARVHPGLRAAGADMNRIITADATRDEARTLALPNDCSRLAAAIRRVKAKLVVIDPLFSFLDGTIDLIGDGIGARRYILRLIAVAQQTRCTILLSRNHAKACGQNAIDSGRGNGELGNTARSVLDLRELPNEPKVYGLSVAGLNDGPPAPTLTYRIKTEGPASIIELIGQSDLTADELASGDDGALDRSLLDAAKALIRTMIPSGRLDSKIVKAKAEAAMISTRTLQDAFKKMGGRRDQQGTRESMVVYWMPPKGGWK